MCVSNCKNIHTNILRSCYTHNHHHPPLLIFSEPTAALVGAPSTGPPSVLEVAFCHTQPDGMFMANLGERGNQAATARSEQNFAGSPRLNMSEEVGMHLCTYYTYGLYHIYIYI